MNIILAVYTIRDLQILLTCRQIYAETKLFPFTSNTSKGSHSALRYATRLLNQEQAHVISAIKITVGEYRVSQKCGGEGRVNTLFDSTFLPTVEEFAKLPQLKQTISIPAQSKYEHLKQV
jgi:hypothetical protein